MSRSLLAPRPVTALGRRAAGAAVLGGSAFIVLIALLHLLQPELDPTWRFVSEYALGPTGSLMTAAFLAMALASAGVVPLMWHQARTVPGRIGAVLAGISGIGMLIAAAFPTDPITTPPDEATVSGAVHLVGGQLNLTPFAVLFLALGLHRVADWRRAGVVLWPVAAVALVSAVGFTYTAATAGDGFGPGVHTGLYGRFMLLAYALWVVLAGVHALRRARAPRRPRTGPESAPVAA